MDFGSMLYSISLHDKTRKASGWGPDALHTRKGEKPMRYAPVGHGAYRRPVGCAIRWGAPRARWRAVWACHNIVYHDVTINATEGGQKS